MPVGVLRTAADEEYEVMLNTACLDENNAGLGIRPHLVAGRWTRTQDREYLFSIDPSVELNGEHAWQFSRQSPYRMKDVFASLNSISNHCGDAEATASLP